MKNLWKVTWKISNCQQKQLILFLYHQVEDGFNFLQAGFGVNKIAKLWWGWGSETPSSTANLLLNFKNPNSCTVN